MQLQYFSENEVVKTTYEFCLKVTDFMSLACSQIYVFREMKLKRLTYHMNDIT